MLEYLWFGIPSHHVNPVQGAEIGSADAGKNRTCWNLTLTLAIPFSRWGASPFIVRPIPYPSRVLDSHASESHEELYAVPHPFQLALQWQREMVANSQLTKARIAVREGLSRARVTQIMNLLKLPESIKQQLQNPPPSQNIYGFNERRLRVLLAQDDNGRRLHD